jgi:hypothetical protein
MIPAKYGTATSPINIGEYIIKCPSCESSQWADVMVMSHYYFFFFIPIFPTAKDANVFCKKCGLKRYGMSFDAKLISEYEQVKKEYRHPWYTYFGAGLAALIILISIIFSLADNP